MYISILLPVLSVHLVSALPNPKSPPSDSVNRGIKVPPELRAGHHVRALSMDDYQSSGNGTGTGTGATQWDEFAASPPAAPTTAAPAPTLKPAAPTSNAAPASPTGAGSPKSHVMPAPGSCAALSKIYSDMGGKSWANQTGWDNESAPATGSSSTMPCCDWFGVVCKSNTISALDLSGNGLNGALSPALFTLPDLNRLNLRLNSITGAIPDSFSSLSNLKILDLSDNFLTGTLPGSLSTHGALSSLHLSDNQLTGLAGFSGSSLANVMINNNAFSGMAISQLSILQRLTANNNQMKGPLPNFSAATALQIFNAANNSFTGPLFDLTPLAALERFDMRNNTLSGPFPRDVSSLAQLSHLFLGGNHLSGVFPDTPAPASLVACNALPNDLQGIPNQETMNDLRSLASKCLQRQSTGSNAPTPPTANDSGGAGPSVKANVVDGNDDGENVNEFQERSGGDPQLLDTVAAPPSAQPHTFAPSEVAIPHIQDVPGPNAPEIPLPPGVASIPIPTGAHTVPGPAPSAPASPVSVPAIGSPASLPPAPISVPAPAPVPNAPPMSELFAAAAASDKGARAGTTMNNSAGHEGGVSGAVVMAMVVAFVGAIFEL